MTKPIISAENLTKSYQEAGHVVPVFNGLDLSLMPGESLAIVGASGVGKTTLLQLLGGLDRPTSGSVSLLGQEFSTLSDKEKDSMRNQHIGFVFQFHHLLPEFSALENVAMPLRIAGIRKKEALARSEEALAQVGLSHRLSHRPYALSGGERQRVAIARALIHSPACILADEPTGNLDHHIAGDTIELMLSLRQQAGGLIIVTHNMAIAQLMDRVIELSAGSNSSALC